MCHNISVCHVYVMLRNVGGVRTQPFFVCVSLFKRRNQWKRLGHKNFLKGTMHFGLSLVSSLLSLRHYSYSESNTILYLDMVYCKVLLYVSVEINPFNHRYFSTQTNLVYFLYHTIYFKCTGTIFARSLITYISDFYYLDLIVSHSLAKHSKISIDLPVAKLLDAHKSLN